MPTPRLLHRVAVKLRKKDAKFTPIVDHNLREPVGQVRRKQRPLELSAQHAIKREDLAVPAPGGRQLHSDGSLLFLTSELRRARVTLEDGDLIIELGSGDNARTVDFYILRLQYLGHYPEHGGPTMVKAFYEDRQPSRRKRGS